MAVYERAYRPYAGPMTRERTRFLILAKYAFGDVFRSRLFTIVFALAFLPVAVAATYIYLLHNARALAALNISASQAQAVDLWFFASLTAWQTFFFGGLITLFAGPGLVSADLSHNGLPLYLARPFTRTEYVVGKILVLVALLSAITWAPMLLLFLLQSYLEGWTWFAANLRIPAAVAVGSGVFIALASLFAMAASALAKRKMVAQTLLLAVVLGGGWVGGVSSALLDTTSGFALSPAHVMSAIWQWLFGVNIRAELSPGLAFAAAAAFCALTLLVLNRKLKAHEVVR